MISRPPTGANISRNSAKALTTIDAAVTVTSKLRANCGSTGVIRPKPMAMMKVAPTRIQISRGIGMRPVAASVNGGVAGLADTSQQYHTGADARVTRW